MKKNLLTAALLGAMAMASHASVVTYNWTGVVVAGASVGGTTAISGTFSYDNAPTARQDFGSYSGYTTTTTSSFVFGTLAGTVTGQQIYVFNNPGFDQFDLRYIGTYSGSTVNGVGPDQFFLRFNNAGTAWNDDALPTSLNPSVFSFPNTNTSRLDGWGVQFQVTSLSAAAAAADATVPEPGTLAAAGLGLVLLALSRRQRKPA